MSMKMCNECKRCDGDRCTYFDNDSDRESTIACILFEPKNPTNGDKIRSMSDEELAELLMDLYDGNKCKYCAYKKSGMCTLRPRHEEYDEGGWVEDEDCIRGMISYLKKEVKE